MGARQYDPVIGRFLEVAVAAAVRARRRARRKRSHPVAVAGWLAGLQGERCRVAVTGPPLSRPPWLRLLAADAPIWERSASCGELCADVSAIHRHLRRWADSSGASPSRRAIKDDRARRAATRTAGDRRVSVPDVAHVRMTCVVERTSGVEVSLRGRGSPTSCARTISRLETPAVQLEPSGQSRAQPISSITRSSMIVATLSSSGNPSISAIASAWQMRIMTSA